jgi:hypothetical protein
MSRKYPKKVRKAYAAKLKAADAFVEAWTTSGIASTLIHDYSCFFNCGEAKAYSDLMRSFGYTYTAEQIIADHSEDCDEPEIHYPTGVWTVDVEAYPFGQPERYSWTFAVEAPHPNDAREKAIGAARAHLRREGLWVDGMYVFEREINPGVPSSMALYTWTDLREAA